MSGPELRLEERLLRGSRGPAQATALLLTALVLAGGAALWQHRAELRALLPLPSPSAPATVAARSRALPATAAGWARPLPPPAPLPAPPHRRLHHPGALEALPQLWLAPGDRLRSQPAAAAMVLAELDRYANVKILESRGTWRLVSWRGQQGWVPAPPEAPAPVGEPAPVLPVAALPPDPSRLAAARRLLGGRETVTTIGPYRLYTDLREPALLLLLDRAAAGLEAAYSERFGVQPIGEPAEAVVLFARRADYDRLVAAAGGPTTGSGHVSSGLVALWREGRLIEEVRATLVHELVHLVNRRALGPALPPWLDEGTAVDLAESRFGASGPLPGTLAEVTLRTPVSIARFGAAASRDLLGRAIAERALPPLAELTTVDGEGFRGVEPQELAYAEAGFLVRFLLSGPRAVTFRAFLAQVAEGGDPGGEALISLLGTDWVALERGFQGWVESQPITEP